jgi:hypothetical protein
MFASSVASAISWAVFAVTITNEVGIAFVTAFFGFLTSSLAAYLAYKTRREAKKERGAVRQQAATVRTELGRESAAVREELHREASDVRAKLREEAGDVRVKLGKKSDIVAEQATKERRIEHDAEGDVLMPPTPEGAP